MLVRLLLIFCFIISNSLSLAGEDKFFIKHSITLELAQKMVNEAIKKAEELGVKQNVAIIDEGGALKAFARMDGAHHLSITVAQNKAYTALLGKSTKDFFESIQDDPGLAVGVPHLDRVITFGGGFPIIIDGQVVGGIGVSGGSVEEDIECVKAALSLLN